MDRATMSSKPCIIIGASHGAVQLSASLRQEGWTNDIIVIGAEPHLPYHRPPLSKLVVRGKVPLEEILLRPESFYDKQNITLKLAETVGAIDRRSKSVTLDSGEVLNYGKLIIATGADPIVLNLPGKNLKGIGYLRNYNDIKMLVPYIKEGKRAVIVGGGYIGLETAAVLRQSGMAVTVLEGMERVLQRVAGPEVSSFYTTAHKKRGVNVVTNAQVSGFSGNGHIQEVQCIDGSSHAADLVVIGIGVRPNIALAEAAGLKINNGICVNEFSQTSDPDIFSVGDCTFFPCYFTSTDIRLESVPNASEQAKSAAAFICGRKRPYTAVPWFWSDQCDIKLQIVGISTGYDQIEVRGDMDKEVFSAWYYKCGRLVAVDCINSPREFVKAKKLVTEGSSPD